MLGKRPTPLVLIHLLAALLLMALASFFPIATAAGDHHHHHHSGDRHDDQHKRKKKKPSDHQPPPPPTKAHPTSSWEQFKSLLSCRSAAVPSQVHDPSAAGKAGSSAVCGSSICALRDVIHGNTRVVHRSDTDPSSASDSGSISSRLETAPLAPRSGRSGRSGSHRPPAPAVVASSCGGPSLVYSRGGMQLRKLSGCYECHAFAAEPTLRRYPRPRTLCACPECGEVFTKPESLEHHQAIRHAVSELGPEDSGRNIVEIIFKSSWQKPDRPIVRIERILKVHNTTRTVARFEAYRDAIKQKALLQLSSSSSATGHRCAADGNELLRFHCTTLACPLGANATTHLCPNSSSSAATAAGDPACGVCHVIRHGFPRGAHHHPLGVRTTASSGRAHDSAALSPPPAAAGDGQRAMLVCRVIAGRVRRPSCDDPAADEAYDSVAGDGNDCGNLEELFVANPRAILPCFVVIYRALD